MTITKLFLKIVGLLFGFLVFFGISFVGTRIGDILTHQAPTTGALVNIGSVFLAASAAYITYGAITSKKDSANDK